MIYARVSAVLVLAGCVDLQTGIPGPGPSSFGVENACSVDLECRGETLRWEVASCSRSSEAASEAIGLACDAWAFENCPDALEHEAPCHVHCEPSAKACPVYDRPIEWPPR